ncbi:hypothetical protein F5148DRAFT_1280304 [Russula earlei]|uniref:Uncharacterized protein n=1 Tax=Russula earlei TaxID=71964 RepID=A0ACC0UM66_9AGAM|nr:hypothetical protein F5148DRAFT_1280304 [Russula earlei]
MPSPLRGQLDEEGRLVEQYVQDAFHDFLKSSLAHAKAERLLDVEVLSGAEGDLMITGPALSLYFAALRSTTDPPSVPLPHMGNSSPRHHLSLDNCPTVFIPFLRLWSDCVPAIQGLAPEHKHDLARVICGLPPLSQPVLPTLNRLAADLRSISIEISQRRSFQDRYASDLQAAIDVGARADPGTVRVKASFVPPPAYTPPDSDTAPAFSGKASLGPPSRSRSRPRSPHVLPPSANAPPRSPATPPTPTIATTTSPAIELIRETLYAALADVFASTPSLLTLLKSDPPRAYFGAVALAVLAVSSSAITPDGAVVGVRGIPLTLSKCPAPLRPLMRELGAIGREAALIEEEDTMEAIRLAQEGSEVPVPRLERAQLLLERGAGHDVRGDGGRRSEEGRAVAFANRVNALALSMTRLPEFRERQDDVFKVLSGIGLSS